MFCTRTAPASNTGERGYRPHSGSKPRFSVLWMETGNVRRLERQPRQRRELRRGRPQRQQLERRRSQRQHRPLRRSAVSLAYKKAPL